MPPRGAEEGDIMGGVYAGVYAGESGEEHARVRGGGDAE